MDYVLVLLVAVALRAATAGSQSLWYDETFTAQIVDGPIGDLLGTVRDTETTPPFTYLLGWVWAQVAGTSDFALRVPAIVFGSIAALIALRATRELATRSAALGAGLLLAVNPFAVWYGQEARAYALLELAGAGLVLALVMWRNRPALGMGLWSGFATLAILTHYPGWVAAAAALIAVAALRSAWPRIEVVALSLAAPLMAAAISAPMLVDQQRKGRTDWIGETSLWDRTLQSGRQFMTGLESPAQRAVGICCALAVGSLCAIALRSRRDTWILGAFVASGVALFAIGAVAGVDIVVARNAIWLLPALVVLATTAVTVPGRFDIAAWALSAALIGVWATTAIIITTNDDYRRPDWHGIIRTIPTDTDVVFVDPWMQRELVRWYAPDVEPRPLPIAHGDSDVDQALEHEGVILLGGDITPAGLPWQRPASVVTSTGEPLTCEIVHQRGDFVHSLACRP